jgi:hypothetical protein
MKTVRSKGTFANVRHLATTDSKVIDELSRTSNAKCLGYTVVPPFKWIEIEINGKKGFVREDVCEVVTQIETIPEIHLQAKALLSERVSRAFPLVANRSNFKNHNDVMNFLNVEVSQRYQPANGQTFCNIYAYDFAYLMGCYIPRVWWSNFAIKQKSFSKPKYAENLLELNANALYNWFSDFGQIYGWSECTSLEAQQHANNGGCAIVIASNKVASRSGHITVVVPETDVLKHSNGTPVQSQAGKTNNKVFKRNWWLGMNPVKFLKCEN